MDSSGALQIRYNQQASDTPRSHILRRAENQRTGLHNAAKDGGDLIVRLVIEEGADVRFSPSILHYLPEKISTGKHPRSRRPNSPSSTSRTRPRRRRSYQPLKKRRSQRKNPNAASQAQKTSVDISPAGHPYTGPPQEATKVSSAPYSTTALI